MTYEQQQNLVTEIKRYVTENLPLSKMDDEHLQQKVEEIVSQRIVGQYCPIEQKVSIVEQVYSSIRGFGLLDTIIKDDTITEVMINGPENVFIEQNGRLFKLDKQFESQRRLEDIIQRIVEFMKYRAPIELTAGLIDRIKKNEKNIRDTIEADTNEPVVEEKKEYYEAEGELLQAAFNTYWALMEYHESSQEAKLNNEKLQSYQEEINSYKSVYKAISSKLISNLYNTSGLKSYSRVRVSLDKYNSTYSVTDIRTAKTVNEETGEETHWINGTKVDALIEELEQKIGAFEAAKSNFENAAKTLANNLPGEGDNDPYAIQWWVQMNNAVNSGTGINNTAELKEAAEAMIKAYRKVSLISECSPMQPRSKYTSTNPYPGGWKEKYKDLMTEVEKYQKNYLTAGKTGTSTYLKAVGNLEKVSKKYISKIKSEGLTVKVDGKEMNLDQALSYMSSRLSAIKKEMEEHINLINHVIWGHRQEGVVSLTKLKELAASYEKELGEWETAANNKSPDTTMKGEDREEIKGIKAAGGSDGEEMAKAITEESVSELNQRLTNIKEQLQVIKGAINRMSYAGTLLTEVGSVSTMKNLLNKKEKLTIPLTKGKIKNLSERVFKDNFRPIDSKKIVSLEEWKMKDPDYNLTINPRNGEVETPELFVYLHRQFDGKTKDEVEDKKAEIDGAKDKAKEAETAALESLQRYNGGGEAISKEYSGSQSYSMTESIKGFAGLLETLLKADMTGIRDDLYVSTYVMEMFSYGTYENEGYYGIMKDKGADVKSLTLSNYKGKYESYKGSEGEEGTWQSENPKDTYNKSLRNKLINKTNNKAYCAEVEYILYGEAGKENSNEKNVRSAYGQIYAFRYILNTVSGFQHFWSAKDLENATAGAINNTALTISAVTQGIVPAGVVKTVLILLLTALETGNDLNRLEAGFPVEMYKSDYEQWWYSLASDTKEMKEATNPSKGSGKQNPDKGFFYSDYLCIFVYLGLNSEAEEDMYKRMGEVMQNNIGKQIGEESSYSLSKAKVYFKIDAKLRVEPLMMALPLFQEYTQGVDLEGDWCSYTIDTVRGYS